MVLLIGLLIGVFISLILFAQSSEQKRSKRIKKIREKLKDVSLADINIYEVNSFASVTSITGDGVTVVEDLNIKNTHEEDGFLYIDGYEFNKDKIINIEYYDIGKAELELDTETIDFHKVVYRDSGEIDRFYTRHFLKEYYENIVIDVNNDKTLTIFLHAKYY